MKKTQVFTAWDRLPVVVDSKTACIILSCSMVTLKKLLDSGRLSACKVGREWRIERDSLRHLFQNND